MASDQDPPPLVFVTVGTDHHPFPRLIDWIEPWIRRQPGVRVVVQRGSARPAAGAQCHVLVGPDDFQQLLASADAVVCSGGPGAIMEARAAGLRPIVTPRRAHLGEHVDDHQHAFGQFLAARDLVTLVEDEGALHRALDEVIRSRDAYAIPPGTGGAEGIEKFGNLVDDLVWGPP
jgi:UDP-N-acetylglucosamine transferase subunit ALG13